MTIPIFYKANVVIVLSHFLEHHPNFAPEGIEELLLLDLASEGHMHAVVVLLNQLG